ncbi:MAG: hypothetical protein J1F01_03650 [Oscillospiraceae bacterium]|nr:hypothetical protein [Oscillospiraceae bacterium]
MYTIDLSGQWRYETDAEDKGIREKFYERRLRHENFTLPGDACLNKVGREFAPIDEYSYEAVRALRPKYEYIGVLWLQRDFILPDKFEDKYITLFLERVNIASDLWIDGIKIDRQIIGISTPHIYNLTNRLRSGKHTITLRTDNRNLLNIDGMASGYSVDTQSIWNGIIGKIEIQCEEIFHLSNIQIFPQKESVHIKLTAHSDCLRPADRRDITLEAYAITPDGSALRAEKYTFTLYNKKQVLHFDYPIKNPDYWSEFNPALYTMNIRMTHESSASEHSVSFGMRTIETKGHDFILNGKKIALRGTLDCGIYPLTGYPPTDIETWLKTFRALKEYGLNHVRFHAWCPPNIAFTAADMTGVYVLAEMPLWLNTDTCALSTGDDPIHKTYFLNEAMNISEHFGNHPSFILFSNGNELLGDHEMLENITTQIKALDPRRLYTLTSNFDRPVTPADDYFLAVAALGNRMRVQVFHDVVSEHTCLEYSDAVKAIDIPAVSFEIGQYCVYPDVDNVSGYTGNLLPANLNRIKKDMIENNVYHMLDEYKKASGSMAAMMYKEDIEASLRTHHIGGFQLLGLADHTGQGTATIGLLDVFWNSKNIITPEEFRNFCSPVVPLMKAQRFFYNTDNFNADFDIYNYSEEKISSPVFRLSLFNGDNKVYETETRSKSVSFPLDFVSKSVMLTAVLTVGKYKNSWNIFIFVKEESDYSVPVYYEINDEFESATENGGRMIVMMTEENLNNPIKGLFKPAFWSPAYFPSERACGLIMNSSHAVFNSFPTGKYAGYQWKHPIDNSVSADVSHLGNDFDYIVEPVPNFRHNIRRSPLFEAKVNNANVLFCGIDLSAKDKCTEALRNSIFKYTASDDFNPTGIITHDDMNKLFK